MSMEDYKLQLLYLSECTHYKLIVVKYTELFTCPEIPDMLAYILS